jgi:hypothetical protein
MNVQNTARRQHPDHPKRDNQTDATVFIYFGAFGTVKTKETLSSHNSADFKYEAYWPNAWGGGKTWIEKS